MNKMLKVMAISVITALFLALPIVAQTVQEAPGADPTSNQRNATATLYKNDVDNYLNVNNYSAVTFEKWFGFIHGTTIGTGATTRIGGAIEPEEMDDTDAASILRNWMYSPGDYANLFRGNLGFATNVGPLYLGLRYYGNAFEDTGGDDVLTKTPTYDPDTQQLTSLTEETEFADQWHNSTNQIDILIGIANMGFRVGFFESMAIKAGESSSERPFIKTDNRNGSITYVNETDEYSDFGGWLRPSLQWGTVLDLAGLTIKPRVGAAFGIFQHQKIDNYVEEYTASFSSTPSKEVIHGAGYNKGLLRPEFTVGADVGLAKKDTLSTTITLDYTINFDIYDNDFSGSGFSGTAKGPVSWTEEKTATAKYINGETTDKSGKLEYSDNTRFFHRIAPRLTLDNAVAEGLNIGLAVLLPTTITLGTEDKYSETKSYTETITYVPINSARGKVVEESTTHTPNGLTETTQFTISPSVRLGAKYALIPERFTVNAGIQLDPTAYIYKSVKESLNGSGERKTSKTTDGDGVVVYKEDSTELSNSLKESSTVTQTWNAFNGQVGGGFVFNFNEKAALDLWVNSGSLSGNYSNWNLDATTVNVMLILKF
jgi:hypothetical protein